eukprot:TRINITY_DN19307_c0_g1_i1.p1 TRINITY_DN19307_c0_g1~~TRINITY_DN19307_c0_g1_i1.p1  ORF type:complete len:545 (+),score=121.65 TRINITY_DN19307_c0_g1_i1:72-1706(+)
MAPGRAGRGGRPPRHSEDHGRSPEQSDDSPCVNWVEHRVRVQDPRPPPPVPDLSPIRLMDDGDDDASIRPIRRVIVSEDERESPPRRSSPSAQHRRRSLFLQLRDASVGAEVAELGAELSNRRIQRLAVVAAVSIAAVRLLRRAGMGPSFVGALATFVAAYGSVGAVLRVLVRAGLELLARASNRTASTNLSSGLEVLTKDLAQLTSVYAYATILVVSAAWRRIQPQAPDRRALFYDPSLLPDPLRQFGGERLSELVQLGFLSLFSWRLTQIGTRSVRAMMPEQSAAAAKPLEELLHTAGGVLGLMFVAARASGAGFQGLLRALGLSGVALALGSQTVIQDLITFVSIVLDQPFVLGDVVSLRGIEGTVEGIGLKSTRIRGFDGVLYVIANRDVSGSTVTNMSARLVAGRRAFVCFEMSPLTSSARIYRLPEVAARAARAANQPGCEASAQVTGFGDKGIKVTICVWSNTEPVLQYPDWTEARHAVLCSVLAAFEREGMELACTAALKVAPGYMGRASPTLMGETRPSCPTTPMAAWVSDQATT